MTVYEDIKTRSGDYRQYLENYRISLTVHFDDPPCDIFGLPHIVLTQKELLGIVSFAEKESNGICFCTGSLGAGAQNGLPEMIAEVGTGIHFFHLLNIKRALKDIFTIGSSRRQSGYVLCDDGMLESSAKIGFSDSVSPRSRSSNARRSELKVTNPGYSAIGRLRGLAELRGLQMEILETQCYKNIWSVRYFYLVSNSHF